MRISHKAVKLQTYFILLCLLLFLVLLLRAYLPGAFLLLEDKAQS